MKGDPVPNGVANYGIKGVESSSNKPPSSKESNLTWTDNQNNLWLLDLIMQNIMRILYLKYLEKTIN